MSNEYRPLWKCERGYYAIDPAFRWLSDEECDWWEERRNEWLDTRPQWTTARRQDVVLNLMVDTTDKGEQIIEYRYEMNGLPTISEDSIKRLLGLLPPAPRSKVDKDEVKARVDMLDLVGSYGAKMRSFGRRASGRCPFHEDRLASFSVDLDRKLWHCFSGCGGGDCFSLVMKKEEVTFREAVNILNERY